MAALMEVPEVLAGLPPAAPDIQAMAQPGDVQQHEHAGAALKAAMKPELFKGWGFRPQGGNQALEDPHQLTAYATKATVDMRVTAAQGHRARHSVVKSMNPVFLNKYGALKAALERIQPGDHMQAFMEATNPDVAKSFTAGNIGINSIYGLTPFNLLAP